MHERTRLEKKDRVFKPDSSKGQARPKCISTVQRQSVNDGTARAVAGATEGEDQHGGGGACRHGKLKELSGRRG